MLAPSVSLEGLRCGPLCGASSGRGFVPSGSKGPAQPPDSEPRHRCPAGVSRVLQAPLEPTSRATCPSQGQLAGWGPVQAGPAPATWLPPSPTRAETSGPCATDRPASEPVLASSLPMGATWVAAGPVLKYEDRRMRTPHLVPWTLHPHSQSVTAPPSRSPSCPRRALGSCWLSTLSPSAASQAHGPHTCGFPRPLQPNSRSQMPSPLKGV